MQQANVPKYIPSGSAAHILDIGRAVRLLSQPPDSLNASNIATDGIPDLGATAALPLPQLGSDPTLPEPGHLPGAQTGVEAAAAGHSGDGSQAQEQEAGVVRLDLRALKFGFQRIAEMPRFSGIAFETAVTEIHEQVSFTLLRPV